jgi:hypothetical protein
LGNFSLGNNIVSSGCRVFEQKHVNGKTTHLLLSWSQKRCIKCQRFLAKHQKEYCAECAKKAEKERDKLFYGRHPNYMSYLRDINPERREQDRLRAFVYSHADELEVGQIV